MFFDSLFRYLRPLSRRKERRASLRRDSRNRNKLLLEQLEDRTVPSTIQGIVFNDLNGDGVRDAGEPGLAGWTLFLDAGDRNSILDSGEAIAVTGTDGSYLIDTTNETGWTSQGVERFTVALVLQTGEGGRWLNSTGAYVVSETDTNHDFGVRLQPFVGVEPVGTETLANEVAAGFQSGLSGNGHPVSIAADAAGNYVVSWRTYDPDGADTIHARIFNADGTPRTGDLLVGTGEGYNGDIWHAMPKVAMSGDGRFAVAWSRFEMLSDGDPVQSTLVRVYDATGTAVTGTVTVAQGSSSASAWMNGLGMDADGDFAVLFGQKSLKGMASAYSDFKVQRYTKTGVASGKAINVVTTYVQGANNLVMDAAGNFTVVWHDVVASGLTNYSQVLAQRFTAGGSKNGSQIVVASEPTGGSGVSSSFAAMNAAGQFAVSWASGLANANIVRVFNADGTTAGEATEFSGRYTPAGVSIDDAGNVTLTWTRYGGGTGGSVAGFSEIYFRRLTAGGVLEPMSIANTTTQGAQFQPGVAATGNGRFVIAWQGYGAGDDAGIFFQRYASNTPGISVMTSGSLIISEAGGTATFSVVLDTQPTQDVIIYLASSNSSEGIVSGGDVLFDDEGRAYLLFTPENWDEAREITITRVGSSTQDVSYAIEMSVVSDDLDYDGFLLDPVLVTNKALGGSGGGKGGGPKK